MTAMAAMASSGTTYLRELEERFLESGKVERKCIDSAGPGSSHKRLRVLPGQPREIQILQGV